MRLTSLHRALLPQEVISLIQKVSPSASGSRLRKSRYCQRTKVCASSIGLETGFELASYSSAVLLPKEPPPARTLPLRRTCADGKGRPRLRFPAFVHRPQNRTYNRLRRV